jgi:UDP-glucose 4-epimerase
MYDESDRVIPLFIRKAMKNEDLLIFGKDKVLDFTYIDDTIDGVIGCIKKFDKAQNNTFNIASGKGTKILLVAKLIKKFLNSKSKIVIKKNRPGEVIKYIADISKAQKLLNYEPKTSIVEGIKKSIEWYKAHVYF